MSVLWFAIPLCLALAPVVVLYLRAAKERRELECRRCRYWAPVPCGCEWRCTAVQCEAPRRVRQ